MKKLLTILFLGFALLSIAADVTYDFSQQGFTNAQKVSSGVIDAAVLRAEKFIEGDKLYFRLPDGTTYTAAGLRIQ